MPAMAVKVMYECGGETFTARHEGCSARTQDGWVRVVEDSDGIVNQVVRNYNADNVVWFKGD